MAAKIQDRTILSDEIDGAKVGRHREGIGVALCPNDTFPRSKRRVGFGVQFAKFDEPAIPPSGKALTARLTGRII